VSPRQAPLALELRTPADPVPVGQDVTVTVALVNRGSEPVVVNRRLLLAPAATPPAFREMTFEVQGPPGYANRKLAHVNAGPPRAEHFAELAPGDSVEKSFELTRLHTLHEPGEYSIRATYSNDAEPEGGVAWVGEVSSDWRVVRRA
jgi:hypothetical protein